MNKIKYTLFLVFIIGLYIISYLTPRHEFGQLFSLFSVLFIAYIYLIKSVQNVREIYFMGIFFRIVLLFAIPNLSDDFYRFIWDGKLLQNGINPYLYLPDEFVSQIDKSEQWLFNKLNSPHYYSVYPPLNQVFFALATYFSGNNILLNVIFLRIIVLFADIITIHLIHRLSATSKSAELMAIYTFNPLVIIELSGNLHFEGVMIMFVLLAYWWMQKIKDLFSKEFYLSAFFMTCAIMTKLLPLVLFPLLIRLLGLKKGIFYTFACLLLSILFFAPFFDFTLLNKILSSVGLYYQKFEFNASFYYLFRAVGYSITGYNMIAYIGKMLALIVFVGIFMLSFRLKNILLIPLTVLLLYYAFATTIHPWYIINILVASIFARLRLGIIWTYLVMLSYFTYRISPYQESGVLIWIEYFIFFGWTIYELSQKSMMLRSNVLNNSDSMNS